jgi:hypothetical protein
MRIEGGRGITRDKDDNGQELVLKESGEGQRRSSKLHGKYDDLVDFVLCCMLMLILMCNDVSSTRATMVVSNNCYIASALHEP